MTYNKLIESKAIAPVDAFENWNNDLFYETDKIKIEFIIDKLDIARYNYDFKNGNNDSEDTDSDDGDIKNYCFYGCMVHYNKTTNQYDINICCLCDDHYIELQKANNRILNQIIDKFYFSCMCVRLERLEKKYAL